MAVDWDDYPTSGRTQWFAAIRAQRPCGVGYGYSVVTTGATGNYAQFNVPWILITDLSTDETKLQYDSETIPPGFTTPLTLLKDTPGPLFDIFWAMVVDRANPLRSMLSQFDQTEPNLRNRFTMPAMRDGISDPVVECPNPWTVTPLTREQVNDL